VKLCKIFSYSHVLDYVGYEHGIMGSVEGDATQLRTVQLSRMFTTRKVVEREKIQALAHWRIESIDYRLSIRHTPYPVKLNELWTNGHVP